MNTLITRSLQLSLAALALNGFVFGTPAHAAIKTRTVEYKQGDATLEGYLAYDDALQGKRPGILVVHDWTGVGPYVKKRAEMLAKLGFVAFAADIYGKGVHPTDPKDAMAEATKYKSNRPLMRARARAGLDQLIAQASVDPKQVAAIGYCFGGTTVLELARDGADVAGTVSFHGGLDTPTPADARNIKGKILALNGGDDPSVPPAQVAAFEKEMRDAKVDWQSFSYGGAVHAFTVPDAGSDPSTGHAYNAKADHRSWQAMKDFFGEVFKSRKIADRI